MGRGLANLDGWSHEGEDRFAARWTEDATSLAALGLLYDEVLDQHAQQGKVLRHVTGYQAGRITAFSAIWQP